MLRYINVPVPLVKELGKPNGQGKIVVLLINIIMGDIIQMV